MVIFPRAVILTIFLRLYHVDLFIHGIGGGNYEWVHDMIIERFFKKDPPFYSIVSATFILDEGEGRDHPFFLYSPERVKNALHKVVNAIKNSLMKVYKKITGLICAFLFLFPAFSQSGEKILLRDDFENLKIWKPIVNEKEEKQSFYRIIKEEGESYLEAVSNDSASAIQLKVNFSVYEYPLLRWRWKVGNVYKNGNASKKTGDDYPIRIYVVFKYDPEKSGLVKKIKYLTAGLFYDGDIPDSALNYIWANREHKSRIIPNPYRKEAMMVIMEKGENNVGVWKTEEVNILEDYRMAFGADPPDEASIIIMNDSDNTGESSISFVDFIEIYKKEAL